MDKLDKFSPKEIKPLKDSPIAQGIISNTIFQILWNGIYFMIGLLIRHYALIFGIPPFLAILFGVAGFFLMALSVNLLRRRKESRALNAATDATLESVSPAQLQPFPEEAKPKLDFEIDEETSQVRVGRGPHEVRAIYADIKLRCFKASESPMAIKGFHASLHRKRKLGDEATVIAKEDSAWIWQHPSNKELSAKDTWTVDEPSTEYRIYHFILHLPPKIDASLSDNHFLRVTMDAVGQEPISQTIYVHDWHVIEGGFSPIGLNPPEELPLAATKEINRLKGELISYEKTNENLGRISSEKDGQITTLEAKLKEAASQTKEDERTITDLNSQKTGLDNELQKAESKLAQWQWLTSEAEKQKPVISEHVKVREVSLTETTLTGLNPTLRFGIKVFNNSLLYVSLAHEEEEHLKGKITFAGYQDIDLRGSKIVLYATKDIPPGKEGDLTIEQRLIDNEPRIIADGKGWPDARFDFSKLEINVIGGKESLDIEATPLDMHNATASAFTVNLLERGQRIRAMAEVRGSAQQLHEALRVTEKPLPKEVFERWEAASQTFLGEVYETEALARVWAEVTDQTPIPNTAASQRAWLNIRIVKMGAFLAELTGEFINRRTLNA